MAKEKAPAWCRAFMQGALALMRDRKEECLPVIFIHSPTQGIKITPLDADKAHWLAIVRQAVRRFEADAVAMIAASYVRAFKPEEVGEVVFPIRNDLQSESVAIFTLKEKDKPSRTWQSKYEHVDGRVVRASEFEFSEAQPVFDRFFDGAFE